MTSTIAVINALNNGQDLTTLLPTRLGGPDAPYRKEQKPATSFGSKTPKQRVVMTEEQKLEKEAIRAKLQVGVWIIEFTKMDGTPAVMEATLDPRLLPPPEGRASTGSPAEVAHLLRVYAIDRQGWRSFSVPNLTRIYRAAEGL
jgi:hypothetical protein